MYLHVYACTVCIHMHAYACVCMSHACMHAFMHLCILGIYASMPHACIHATANPHPTTTGGEGGHTGPGEGGGCPESWSIYMLFHANTCICMYNANFVVQHIILSFNYSHWFVLV